MHILDSKKRYDYVSICPSVVPGVLNVMSCRVRQRRDQEKKIISTYLSVLEDHNSINFESSICKLNGIIE